MKHLPIWYGAGFVLGWCFFAGYWWCDADWKNQLVERGLMNRTGGVGGGTAYHFKPQTPTHQWQQEAVKRGFGEFHIQPDGEVLFFWKDEK